MLQFFLQIKPIRDFVIKADRKRIALIISRIKKYLPQNKKILDIGCGLGLLSSTIKRNGYDLTVLDVHDISISENIKPIIFDGSDLPFDKNTFDTTLFITVLHHTPNPELLVKEATRVSKRIIIMEDIFENIFQKFATYMMDSIVNLEFLGHPHSNKDETEWLSLFKRNKLSLLYKDRFPYWGLFLSALYVVERK